mgnify:CR=1 FL=1
MLTPTVIIMATNTDALLQLIWLASPALPVGGFSYSEGLEAAIASGHVHNTETASTWLTEQLWLTQARGDLSALGAFMQAWRDVGPTRHACMRAQSCVCKPNKWGVRS